jgi:hypothetical protein
MEFFGMSRKYKSQLMRLLLILPVVLLSACGDDDATPVVEEKAAIIINTGFFKDSAVSGIQYSTATQSGVTASSGAFNYIDGEIVTFRIGDIIFPSTMAAFNLTPIDFIGNGADETNIQVTNISRLLQTLDTNHTPSDGIEINQEAIDGANGIALDFSDPNFGVAGSASQNYIDSLGRDIEGVSIEMVSEEVARAHLLDTLSNIRESLFTVDFIAGSTFSVSHEVGNLSELYFKQDLTGTLKTSEDSISPLTWEINVDGELILTVLDGTITTIWEFTEANTEDGVASYTYNQPNVIFEEGLGEMTKIDNAFLAEFLEGNIFTVSQEDSTVSQLSFLADGLGSIEYLENESRTISWSISLGVLTIVETDSDITWVFTATTVSNTAVSYAYTKAKDGVITRSDEGPYTLSIE